MTDFDRQNIVFIRQFSQSAFDDAPRAEHQIELRERMLREYDRAASANVFDHPWSETLSSWRQTMRRPLPRLIASAVLILSITAPWLFFPGQQTTVFGFNKLAAAIVEARTAKFKMEITVEGSPTQTYQAYYLAPGKTRMEMSILGVGSTVITDDLTGRIVTIMPLTKTAIEAVPKNRDPKKPSENPFVRIRELIANNPSGNSREFKSIGEREFNGQRASGFQSDSAIGSVSIWGDPTTGALVRAECDFNGSKKNTVVMSEIQINVELDQKLFEMTPPAGYSVQTLEVDLSPATEQSLIDSFKYCYELSGGELPDTISLMEPITFYFKHSKSRIKEQKEPGKPDQQQMQSMTNDIQKITKGFSFAFELPEEANAQYAGKGVKQDAKDRAIFWYQTTVGKKYRVIYADLSVKESDTAPSVDGATPLTRPKATPPSRK